MTMNDENPPARPGYNFDRMAAILAIAVSFAAMAISLLEVTSVRAQQNASVWPYVEIEERYSQNGFQLRLTNKGVGPALMGDIVLLANGTPLTDIDAFIAETVGEKDAFSYDVYETSNPSGSVVSAGESYDLFSVPWEERTRLFVNNVAERIDIEACYCSIHDDCWTLKMSSPRPVKTAKCENAIEASG